MQEYTYIGLKTGNQKYKLEISGIGDRILRWHIVMIWATITNNKVIIPLLNGKLEHEKLWSSKIIKKFFKFPDNIRIVDYTKQILSNPIPFYLEEPSIYFSAFNYWKSIPNNLKNNITQEEFNTITSKIKLEVNLENISFKIPPTTKYIILHIRQSDKMFNANNLITQLIPFLISLSVEFKIILISDGTTPYINHIIKILKNNGVQLIDTYNLIDKSISKPELVAIDYNLMWNSNGIISLTKRGYSAFPYCIALQQNILLLFYPNFKFKVKTSFTVASIEEFIDRLK